MTTNSKTCRNCTAKLLLSDPDLCERCDMAPLYPQELYDLDADLYDDLYGGDQ